MKVKNDFIPVSAVPKLVKFWDFDKNKEYDVNMTSIRMDRPDVHWRCRRCGYEWMTSVAMRYRATDKCPCCDLGQVIKAGFNDAATVLPDIMTEWDKEKNDEEGIIVYDLGIGSPKPVNWLCPECGRRFRMPIGNRVKKQKDGTYHFASCPHRKEKAIPTVSEVPKLIRFWDETENSDKPDEVKANSKKTVFWKCKRCGYKWQAPIVSRYNSKDECPCCDQNRAIVAGYNDIVTLVPEIMTEWDKEKNAAEGIIIEGEGLRSKKIANWKCPTCGREFRMAIGYRVRKQKDGSYRFISCPHKNTMKRTSDEVPKISEIPKLIKFWDRAKNNLDPETTPSNSTEKAYWKCPNPECGYEWEQDIRSRERSSDKCPYCERKTSHKIQKGCPKCNEKTTTEKKAAREGNSYKSMDGKKRITIPMVTRPEIMKFWDYDRNKDINPETISAKSVYRYSWKCPECGYEWTASVKSRFGRKRCPCCQNLVIVKGINDALTVLPELAEIYDFDNNPGIDIYSLSVHSPTVVNFRCRKCGYTWRGALGHRVRYDKNKKLKFIDCPKCSNGRSRDIPYAEQYPQIAGMCDEKASGRPMSSILTEADTYIKMVWVCPECHERFEATMNHMIRSIGRSNHGCPYCNRRQVMPGYNSLKALHPELMSEWLALPNSMLADPDRISESSKIKVWWECPQGHHYPMSPAARLMFQRRNREACPYCKGRRVKLRHFY